MDRFDTPYDQYQARGYSAKQTFATIFGGVTAVGIVAIAAYVVVKFLSALDDETMHALSLAFFTGVICLVLVAGSLGTVAIFRYIQKPGIQMPGILGKLEEKFEEKR